MTCPGFTNTQTKPISSPITCANLLPSNGGNGAMDDMSNSSIVFARSLQDCHKEDTIHNGVQTYATGEAFRCPSSDKADASSSWWLSRSVGLGTTIRGFPRRSTSRIVPDPTREN